MQAESDPSQGLRARNRAAVLNALHLHGDLSRKQLSSMLRLTPAAMTKIAADLIGDGLISESGASPAGGVGRREILLTLRSDARYAPGIWIGLGSAILSAVSLSGETLFSETVPLPFSAPAEPTVRALCERLIKLSDRYGLKREAITGVGIAVRGVVDPDGRTVQSSFDALDTAQFEICALAERCTGMKTVLSNNVRALSAAQMFFSREADADSFFFVRCGTGIGAALVTGGRILTGSRGQSAEIGHIPVIRQGGKPCHCGKSGCLETVASPTAIREDAQAILSEAQTPLLWQLTEGKPEAVTVERVLDAAAGGDSGAAAIVDRAIEALASALKHVVYLVDPGQIVLYGSIFEHPYYLSRLKAEMTAGVDAAHAIRMEKSRFNNRLEHTAAGLLSIVQFYHNGGIVR